ncbi:cysteine desulfurase family protein [Butyrivibrio sp. WCD3002]|uniref:cysteine desulfurase family protein n=1 Tax=Butyrivibrio sp. WCD3002 TaxID=1280676 RepID=UPI00040EB287|nr:cysteine desulfurase family protein [Butyrivibrio sp. WCD3002]
MEIYLDNSATTRVYKEVADLVVKTMTEDYGNPSSMHHMGVVAENYTKQAAEQIAKTLKVNAKDILFTSGGTESDNTAIIGGAMAKQRLGKHLITTAVEHPAVLNTMKYLEEQGFEVTYLGVGEDGRINLAELESAIREDTILVSIMAVNNEIGARQPVEEAAQIIHKKNPDILFHVDAVQGYGKYRFNLKQAGIDMMSVSGHKIHGPKGIGFLYVRSGVRIIPISYGGGQQGGLRSGTLNVPGIAGLGLASEMIYKDFDEKSEKLYSLKKRLIKGLSEKLPDIRINGLFAEDKNILELSDEELSKAIRNTAPHIISVSVKGVRAEVLLHALEDKEIYVSAGSACATNHPSVSATLKAVSLPKELLDSTVRLSMSEFTTEQEIDDTVEAFAQIIPMLRQFARR